MLSELTLITSDRASRLGLSLDRCYFRSRDFQCFVDATW